MPTLSFGKYAGVDLRDVPRDYVEWLISSRKKDLAEYEAELERRELVEAASVSMGERIIQAGFRALSKQFHPDSGGSDAQFIELKAGYEQLKMVMEEVKRVGQNSDAPTVG